MSNQRGSSAVRKSQTFHVPGSACPCCGKRQDQASTVNGQESPEPGAIGICWDCGAIQIYGEDLQLRNPTREMEEAQARVSAMLASGADPFARFA